MYTPRCHLQHQRGWVTNIQTNKTKISISENGDSHSSSIQRQHLTGASEDWYHFEDSLETIQVRGCVRKVWK